MLVRFIFILFSFFLSEYSLASELHDKKLENNFKDNISIAVVSNHESNDLEDIDTLYKVGVDYLKNILDTQDVSIKIVVYKNSSDLFNALENGRVDGAVGFSINKDRLRRFLFSEPIFDVNISAWFANPDKSEMARDDLRWVCVTNSVYCTKLELVGVKHISKVENLDEAIEFVSKGHADAVLSNFISISENLGDIKSISGVVTVPSWLQPEKIRFITSFKNQWLVNIIDKILLWEKSNLNIRSVSSGNPYHQVDFLIQKFKESENRNLEVTYSSSESAYPFIYINEIGNPDGFLHDFFNLLSSRTGLEFKYKVPSQKLKNEFSAFSSDIVPIAYIDKPKERGWQFTNSFLDFYFVSISSKLNKSQDSNEEGGTGVLTGFTEYGTVYLDAWKHQEFVRYSDLKLMLSDLRKGKIKTAYVPSEVEKSIVLNNFDNDFIIGGSSPLKVSLAFAVRGDIKYLTSLLNVVFDTIGDDDIDKLRRNYQYFNVDYGFHPDKYAHYFVVATIMLSILAFITYLIFHNLNMKVQIAQLNVDSEESEKLWLMSIIKELSALIFVHNENNNLIMTNCSDYEKESCKNCELNNIDHVANEIELGNPVMGEIISLDNELVHDCSLKSFYFYKQVKVLESPNSHAKYFLTTVIDVTEQKKRESNLILAEKKAKEATLARERFLAIMSHELRTPIAAAQGLLELMENPKDKESCQLLVSQSRLALDHLNKLVDEVLDFSKIESGELSVSPITVNVKGLILDALRTFDSQAEVKGINFIIDIQPNCNFWLKLDPTRVKQIIINLVSNSIKFTRKGYIRVWASIDDRVLSIKVIDSGIGMCEEQIAQVKKPFVQAEATISREFGGTGLGLSIVDKLISCMGGNLEIESKLGVGTTISVSLPAELGDETVSIKLTEREMKIDSKENIRIDGTILVAEDNSLNQYVISMQLKELGVDFHIVNNGREALEYLNDHPTTSLVITDLHMPIMTGYELSKIIRKTSELKGIFVIGVTAEDSRLVNKAASESGIDKILFKPYGIKALKSVLFETVKQNKSWLLNFPLAQRQSIAVHFISSMANDSSMLENSKTDDEIHSAIHSLKGAAGTIGLHELTELCLQYEKASVKDKSDIIKSILSLVRVEVSLVKSWILDNDAE